MEWINESTKNMTRYELKHGEESIAILQKLEKEYYLKNQINNKTKCFSLNNMDDNAVKEIAEKTILDMCKESVKGMNRVINHLQSKRDLENDKTIKLKYTLGEELYLLPEHAVDIDEIETIIFTGIRIEEEKILYMYETLEDKVLFCLEEDNNDIFRTYQDAEYEYIYRNLD